MEKTSLLLYLRADNLLLLLLLNFLAMDATLIILMQQRCYAFKRVRHEEVLGLWQEYVMTQCGKIANKLG